jgi:hypothetical protein
VPGGHYRRRVAAAAARSGVTLLFTSEPRRLVVEVDGCLTVGRYPVTGTTTSVDAAAAAAGDSKRWLLHAVGWTARKTAKRLGGRRYDGLRRRALASRRDDA